MAWPPRRPRRGCGSHMPQNTTGGGTPRSAGGVGQRLPGLLEGPTLLTSWLQTSCSERSLLSLQSFRVFPYGSQRPCRENPVQPTRLTHKEAKVKSVS